MESSSVLNYLRQRPIAPSRERFVVEENGRRVAVLLDMAEYKRLLEKAEELESIRAYDAATASHEEIIPFEQAVAEIEQERR